MTKIDIDSLYNLDASYLYIHIPFCKDLCSYCDFCKYINNSKNMTSYINSLILDLQKLHNKNLKTIFIGGGTPSYLDYSNLERLLTYISKNFKIEEEFTIECNPDSLTEDKIKLFSKCGVNRVSIGVESTSNKTLEFLNRKHTNEDVEKCIELLHKYNINNINMDFIYGVYFEKYDDILSNIEFATKLNVTHISYYALQVEQGTKLYLLKDNVVDDDKLADEYEFILNQLEKRGYKRYEVSNFSKIGYESKHNIAYWRNYNFYGVGISSSGFNYPHRYKITSKLLNYINRKNLIEDYIKEDNESNEFNYLMLNLRLVKGFKVEEFNTLFNKDFFKEYPSYNKISSSFNYRDGYLSIKKEKLYILDELLVELLHFKIEN